ncbi:hypothetical protein EJB05_26377 [Eragrostis curvula]|uniref:HMA domain-containing protein n=1 Tax=Eragrostis curvula TaxID=38414 RepID=A0A5J9UKQ3_9POAL|nr:hypothetical protein EJB05_26377 [Eragrostis curvula]
MAEKISMLIIKVDLDCHKCYDKMRKILCRLQDCERITTISFDDKGKTIAVVGPFDPIRLACKIRCKGGKVVKDIHIVDAAGGGGKPPPPMMEGPPPNNSKKKPPKGKPASPPPEVHQAPPSPQHAPPQPQERPPSPPSQPGPPGMEISGNVPPDMGTAATAQHAELEQPPPPSPHKQPVEYMPPPSPQRPVEYMPPPQKPVDYMPPPPMMKPRPPPMPRPLPEPQYPVECTMPTVEIPSYPAAPVASCGCGCGCPCCCAPSYQGYYDGCRCGCGGGGRMVYGYAAMQPRCGYQGCRIINEEDPNAACSIM